MKKWARILCLLLCCTMVGLTCTACLPMRNDASDFDPDNFDPDNPDENPNVNPEEFELFGTKVLYHPSNYIYDGGEGASTDYFGEYSYAILDAFSLVYGYFGSRSSEYVDLTKSSDYIYDSIRYNLNRQDEYIEKHTVRPLEEGETVPPEADGNHVQDENGNWYMIDDGAETDFSPYATIYVDTDLGWNWKFNSEMTPPAFIYYPVASLNNNATANGTEISNNYLITESGNNYFLNVESYYQDYATAYTTAFAGELDQADAKASQFSDLTKALKYVLYCVSMNMTPENIAVDSSDPNETRVTIGNFESVDAAVEYAENIFSQYGLYVGISEYGRQQLVDYILNNVIGERAINADSVAINKYAVYSYTNEDGEEVEFYKLIESEPALQIDRQYETAVENIVTALFEDVDIGADNDKINNKYLASYFRDYFGNQFSTSMDDGNEFGEKDGALPQEYQSIILMPREDLNVEDLTLAFKYVGNMESITINVHINAYVKGEYMPDLGTAQITVKQGEYDAWGDGDLMIDNLYEGHTDYQRDGLLVRKFDTNIMHPDGMVYNGTMEKSDEIPINGASPYRRIYEVVETSNGQYYGRISAEQWARLFGDNDFFEICFEIVNRQPFGANGQLNDYKFYTGLTVF